MPEELALLLVILFAVGFVIFALIRFVWKIFSEVRKSLTRDIAQFRKLRFSSRKSKLAGSVRLVLPENLSDAERKVQCVADEFQRRRAKAKRAPVRPVWDKTSFLKQRFSPQTAFCSEMNISEIDYILSPNFEPWSEKEQALLAQDCSYPGRAPIGVREDFGEFVVQPLQIEEPLLDYDRNVISEKDFNHYFQDDRAQFEKYNGIHPSKATLFSDLIAC